MSAGDAGVRDGARPRRPRGWERAVREHRAALDAFLEAVERQPSARWRQPVAEQGWTPAQIAEHLALVYEAVLAEMGGGAGMRARVGPAMRTLLRWVMLPHILFHRSFPVRARAPREARPSGAGLEQQAVRERLSGLAERVERALAAAPAARVSHPYFGRLTPVPALRFCAVHIEHHRRQLLRAAAPTE